MREHSSRIRQRARDLTIRHLNRVNPLGVEPHLVVVFELGAPLDADEFKRSGLRVVDSSNGRVIVAFADDPEMAKFHERLDQFQGGVPEGRKNEPYASFFDAINDMRSPGPADRVTADALKSVTAADPPDTKLRLDVECWHPGEPDRAVDWLEETKVAVEATGGTVVDRMVNDAVGLLLARAYVPANRMMELAELDVIARIDVLPRPALTVPQLFSTEIDHMPRVLPPSDSAPVVGLVDSGVASANYFLAGAVAASDALGTGIEEDQDEHGHGTMVASVLLHGDIAKALARELPLRPMCKVASARVLDANNQFSAEDLWERDLVEATTWCVAQGATIVNLSIGDDRSSFQPPRQMSAAAIVDDLVRRHGLVVVVATGNSRPADYLDIQDESAASEYPAVMLKATGVQLIDPATSMLGLTVGGITDAAAAGGLSGSETVRRIPMGQPNWPSPITRIGPGPGGAVKPEVVHRSGTLGLEGGQIVSNDAELGVIGARAAAGRLLSWDVGTSYSAPAVSRIAAAVLSRFPEFTSEMIRALVLISTVRLPFAEHLEGLPSARLEGERYLMGYGKPSIARAIESTSHRVILVATDTIPIDGVHIYEVPIPTSFLQPGGKRGIDVSLAYSPRTRLRRLDYMATRMEFHLVKGLPLEEVAEIFAKFEGEDLEDSAEQNDEASVDSDEVSSSEVVVPRTPTELGSRVVRLEPATQIRSRGANQLGRKVFSQRLTTERDLPAFLVVRNINRWDDATGFESYALTVALWRDEDGPDLHAELEAQLEAVVELPVEIEIEL